MSGVAWERLTHDDDPYVDFLHVEYGPGSASCPPDDMVRHGGREYGHVVSGRLDVQVGFETHRLGPGDSIHFDSTTPHRLSNPYDEPCTAVWFVLARRDDERVTAARPSTTAHLPGLL
jgi:mannose-6-phosphate isomerase-like protein (cupin superfamily)